MGADAEGGCATTGRALAAHGVEFFGGHGQGGTGDLAERADALGDLEVLRIEVHSHAEASEFGGLVADVAVEVRQCELGFDGRAAVDLRGGEQGVLGPIGIAGARGVLAQADVVGGTAALPAIGGVGVDRVDEGLRLQEWEVERLGDDLLMHGWVDHHTRR